MNDLINTLRNLPTIKIGAWDTSYWRGITIKTQETPRRFRIKIQATGNMGTSLDNVNESLAEYLETEKIGIKNVLSLLRESAIEHNEKGSPDYIWTGFYKLKK